MYGWDGPKTRRSVHNTSSKIVRQNYALALYQSDGATLDDIREAVTTLEETERIARRVLGGAHPETEYIADELREARGVLSAHETPSPGPA